MPSPPKGDDLATFSVADMQISGEFNFVYCNERVAKEKINLLFTAVEPNVAI